MLFIFTNKQNLTSGGSRSSAKFVEEIKAFIESLNKELMTLLRKFCRRSASASAYVLLIFLLFFSLIDFKGKQFKYEN